MRKVALVALLLCSCTPPPLPANDTPTIPGVAAQLPDAGPSTVYRVIDPETRIVCYVSDGYKSGGISCLHMEQTP